jgi:hypothetical protein
MSSEALFLCKCIGSLHLPLDLSLILSLQICFINTLLIYTKSSLLESVFKRKIYN